MNTVNRSYPKGIPPGTLPTKIHPETNRDGRNALIDAGVQFGDVCAGNPLFRHVKLPTGWRVVPTEFPSVSHLLGDKNHLRGMIVHAEAEGGLVAHLTVVPRFTIRVVSDSGGGAMVLYAVYVQDAGHTIHTVGHGGAVGAADARYSNLVAEAQDWLNEHFPDWRNVRHPWPS